MIDLLKFPKNFTFDSMVPMHLHLEKKNWSRRAAAKRRKRKVICSLIDGVISGSVSAAHIVTWLLLKYCITCYISQHHRRVEPANVKRETLAGSSHNSIIAHLMSPFLVHSSNKTEFMGSAKKEGQFHSSSQTTIVKICLKIEFISAIVFDIQINFLIVPER